MSSDEPPSSDYVVGLNQSIKAIRKGKAKKIFLANDADEFYVSRVTEELNRQISKFEIDKRYDSITLAQKYNIDVPTAIVTEL